MSASEWLLYEFFDYNIQCIRDKASFLVTVYYGCRIITLASRDNILRKTKQS